MDSFRGKDRAPLDRAKDERARPAQIVLIAKESEHACARGYSVKGGTNSICSKRREAYEVLTNGERAGKHEKG